MGVYQNHQLALAGNFGEGATAGLEWGTSFPAWFQAIPPERVGLHGEYDHYGLKKRVEAVFKQSCSAADLADVTVNQRGRVVILQGRVASKELLWRLVELASGVEGATKVECGYCTICDVAAEALTSF